LHDLDAIVWEATASDFQFTFVSQRASELLGYPQARWLAEPDFWRRHLHPEDRERAVAFSLEAVREGRDHEFEYRMLAADGHVVWLRNIVHVVPSADGRPGQLRGLMVNITQRKRAEAELRSVVTGANCLLWHAQVRAIEDELVWTVRMWDDEAAQRFLPLAVAPGQSYAEAWYHCKPPEDRQRIAATGNGALRAGQCRYHQEFRCRTREGDVRWLFEDVHVEPQVPGHWRLVGVCTDITERKRSEDAIRYIARSAHCLLWYAEIEERADGSIAWQLQMSDEEAAQRLLPIEVPPGERWPQAWYFSRIEPDRRRTDEYGGAQLRANRDYRQEYRCRTRDGDLRWLAEDVHLEPLAPGPAGQRRWRAVGVCTDVTDRKRVEEALREREQRFRALVENSSDAVALMDDRGNIGYASLPTTRVLGYPVEEFVGQNAFDLMHPEDRPRCHRLFEELLARPGVPVRAEFRLCHQDGSWREVEGVGVNRLDEPAVAAVVGNFRDITERKELEERLRQAQKMEAVGQLAGGIAHEFNNLLAVVLGYSDLMLQELGPGNPLRHPAEEIRRAATRGAAVTRQILAFSRRQLLAPRDLDVNEMVAGLLRLLQRLLGEHLRLASNLASVPTCVRADASQLEQAIINLAVNARDAMPHGGTLTLSTARVELDAAAARARGGVDPGPYVVLSVADTGCGMDAATVAQVFEPFFTTKGVGQGTGLGLSTVYGIVEQSGGHITVESELGRGTTFRVYLPWSEPDAGTETDGDVPPDASETVLVVEDEPLVRELVAEMLQSAGYQVLVAGGGAEAIRLAESHAGPIQLLLTDVVMPELGGRELARQLADRRPEVRVLYMTGYTDDVVLRHGDLGPGAAILQKPFTAAALARQVREALGSR
jgi:PAS domain S-box-containing protein